MKPDFPSLFFPSRILLFLVAFSLVLAGCQSTDTDAQFGRDAAVIAKARQYGLVHVPARSPDIRIDLRYRTSENATGKPLYPSQMPCLLHAETIERLNRAQRILKKQGYGLLILDAWRPPESHRALWDAVQDPRWVVPPSDGLSLHCYGLAVDVTLVDAQGREQRMPSAFDEFSERAKSDYQGSDETIRANVIRLREAMTKAGFRAIEDEWWHFDIPEKIKVYRIHASTIGLELPQ